MAFALARELQMLQFFFKPQDEFHKFSVYELNNPKYQSAGTPKVLFKRSGVESRALNGNLVQ